MGGRTLRYCFVFPAPAGMNRDGKLIVRFDWGVPRACGDEPASLPAASPPATCSPRLRG